MANGLQLVKSLAEQLGGKALDIIDAIKTNPSVLLQNLLQGLQGAASQLVSDLSSGSVQQILYKFLVDKLGLGQVGNVDFSTLDYSSVTSVQQALMQYAGLTWANVQQVLQQQLGAGNYAAASTVAKLLQNVNVNDPTTLFTWLQNLPTTLSSLDPAEFSGLLSSLNWNTLAKQLFDAAKTQLMTSLTQMGAQVLAKFVPGVGVATSLYQGLTFLMNNQQQLGDFFQGILGSMDDLLATVKTPANTTLMTTFTNDLVNTFENKGLPALLGLAWSQLGLNSLTQSIQTAVTFVPTQVDAKMRQMVSAIATKLVPSNPGGLFAGQIAAQSFTYNGQTYTLWVAKDSSGTKVKIASGSTLVGVLTAASFDSTITPQAAAHLQTLVSAANAIVGTGPGSSNLAISLTALTNALNVVKNDITANGCVLLNAGCFAAGTKLWTPQGYRNVEEIQPNELVYARDEFDPCGAVAAKLVQEKFERTGRILHLHFEEGLLLRTTPEHRFYLDGRGWTVAGALQPGDQIRTKDGWQTVADVHDTGEYDKVYNLRVAEYHTYFVGAEEWGFVVWAHNDYYALAAVLRDAPDVGNTDFTNLVRLARRMPQAASAQSLTQAQFTAQLETKLRNQNLLGQTAHLSNETATAAKAAAEIHGNTGRTPTILINPGAANPYNPGTIAAGQWDAITTWSNSNPTVNGLRLRMQLPGQPNGGRYFGLPYAFARAQYYAGLSQLVDVEHPTTAPLPAGNGECDLLLTGNRLVDCKAWSPTMWSDASLREREGMIARLVLEVEKYLGDSAGYTLRLEFEYAIPAEVLTRLNLLATLPAYAGRLSWAANVT